VTTNPQGPNHLNFYILHSLSHLRSGRTFRLLPVCLCLYVSITRRYCTETASWIKLIFCCRFFSTYMLCCILRKLGYLYSNTPYIHKLLLWARVTNETLERNLKLAYAYLRKKDSHKSWDQIHLVPRFSPVGKTMSCKLSTL